MPGEAQVPANAFAHVLEGTPRPDGEETLEVAWFAQRALAGAPLTEFTHSLFEAVGVSNNPGFPGDADVKRSAHSPEDRDAEGAD